MSKLTSWFYNLKVRTKFITLIGIFLLTLIILGLVTELLFRSSQTVTILVNEERVFVENFDLAIENFYRYVTTEDQQHITQSKKHLQKAVIIAREFSRLDTTMHTMPDDKRLPYMYEIYKEGVDYDRSKIELMTSQIKMFSLINPGMLKEIQLIAFNAAALGDKVNDNIDAYVQSATPEKLAELQEQFKGVHQFTNQFSSGLYKVSRYITRLLYLTIAIFVFLLGIVVTYASVSISNTISRPINRLAENFKDISKGNLKSALRIDYNNEIGELSKALNTMQIGLRDIIAHAKKVAKGDFSSRLTPNSAEDELTPALNAMAAKLEESKIKAEKENWLQKGLNDLDDQMRGNHTVRELSARIVTFLNQFLGVEMGAVYVFDEVLGHLELTGTIGINKNELMEFVQIGEGLVGNAARSNECQMIDVKDKFHKIYSAAGEIYPEKLYLIPMYFNDRIQVVIELACINRLSELKVDFLRRIKGRVSVNINASVARFRANELLDKMTKQTEVLKAQDLELKKQLEENKIIHQNLLQETALLNSMLSTLPDYVYFKDKESRFLRISESMVDLFSAKSSDELIGKSDFDYHPPKDAKKYYEEEQAIIRTGEGFIDEVRQGINERGEELWTSVTKLPMYDESGECIGTFGISKDITKIKKLEIEVNLQNDKLKQSQEELKATNEELNAQEEELRVANEELAEQTKILVESEKNLQAQQEELRVANEELEAKTNLLELQKNEILLNNRKLAKIGSDLEQKAKELEMASQYKSEFLANMSHELRTPLNSMLILSKLLRDNKNNNLNDDQLKSVSIIYNSGRDLLELINEILDLSKVEAGKMTFDFDNVESESICEEIKYNFKPVAEDKHLRLSVQRSADFPQVIFTDKQRLMQIIKNLLSNAFKFTSKGEITVDMGLPEEGVHFVNPELNHENTFYFAVKDTGVGIPKNKVEAIFEAFQQADGSISRKFGGTGLGLSISKQLTRALGGEIHVNSTEGVGSVFTVYLPISKEHVGREYTVNNNENRRETQSIHKVEEIQNEQPKDAGTSNENLPYFISDDRNSATDRVVVLIIHNDREKAKKLIEICHDKKFNALVAAQIPDGLMLAEKYSPQAIIVSADLNHPLEISKLKESKFTSRIPLHVVSRIEDSLFDEIHELETPESKDFDNDLKSIENKIRNEFRQVLVVEDDPATMLAIQKLFEENDIIIHEAKTATQAYEMISSKPFDCIILDLGLPDYSGLELLEKLSANKVAIPYVIINTAKELNAKELRKLGKYSDSIVIKGVKSDERLMDEVTLFLHQVSNTLPKKALVSAENDENNVFKGKKVLVVDDDIRNVFAMVQILEEREIEIFEAENGEVAVEVLKNNTDIDLVLMDVMMPVMNGYDAMKLIRNTPEIEHIPIITLTAKAMKEDYQKAIDSGANDFISKPVDIDRLLSLLKIWLFN